jgi:hypothetical protein
MVGLKGKFRRCVAAFALLAMLPTSSALAVSDDQFELDAEKQAMAEQMLQLTLSDLPGIQQDIRSEDGELLVRAGTPPEDFLSVYDMGWQNLTINEIEELSGEPVTNLPVSAFPGLYKYLSQESKSKQRKNQFALLLKPWKLLEQPAIAQTTPPPSAVVPINSLPGVGNIQLQTITGPLGNPTPSTNTSTTASGASGSVSSIPGLSAVPILSSILSLKDYFIPLDFVVAGGKNYDAPCKLGGPCNEQPVLNNSASGNWKSMTISCDPKNVEVKDNECSLGEVRRRGGMTAQNNIRWFSKLHKVKWGDFLCTKEPTGRFPFGKNPKLVMEQVSEVKDEATFALYFQVYGPFDTESAHCFGPVPLPFFGTRKVGDLIIFGLDKPSLSSPLSGLVAGIPNPGDSACPPSGSSVGGTSGQQPQFQQAAQSDLVPVTTAPHLNRQEYLHRDAAGSFEQMVQAAKQSGVYLYALSGYRSVATQQQLLANNPNSTQIAQPGQSEHHTGYAVDISNGDPKDDANDSFGQSEAYQWLAANASKYGFVQSYKAGSQYGAEPWHWRWQGNSTAQQVFNTASSGSVSINQSNQNCGPQNLPAPVSCNGQSGGYRRPSNGIFTSGYGWRWGKLHQGVDISGGFGSPIFASNCGVVTQAKWNGGYGYELCISHTATVVTCYAHTQKMLVKVGDQVQKGQVIAEEGSTGQSTGPHVHFEFQINGIPENPEYYVPI